MGDARTLSAPIDDLKQRVDRIRWWHTIDLGGGVITPGASDNLKTLPKLGLPERLDGKAVLDIGAWDGFYSIDVVELSPDRVGTFDLVLCLGVLYHMRHPALALERVFSVTGDQLILETHVDLLTIPRPAIALYPHGELDGDPTSWCGPNPAAVEAMLGAAGFQR